MLSRAVVVLLVALVERVQGDSLHTPSRRVQCSFKQRQHVGST
jgi:uncharacterized membrane protein